MSKHTKRSSRRNVLRATGAGLLGSGLAGSAVGRKPELVTVNVGYAGGNGRGAVKSAANEVVRDYRFDALTIRIPETAVDALAGRSDVRYLERDGTMQAHQTTPWGIDRVDAPEANAEGATGAGVDIAIVDTGIDPDHPDLNANVGTGNAYVNCSSGCDRVWDDDNSHGTHCAGIAAAEDNGSGVVGVAPEATLHAMKVLDSGGSGTWSDVAAGIEGVAVEGWDIASMSLGGGSSSVVSDAVTYADNNGVFLVASAGNSYGGSVGYPAAYPEVMAISSTDSDDSLSGFSSTGSAVDLAAPGGNVYSTTPGGSYGYKSGTSMACPHVAGAAAVLLDGGYSRYELQSQLQSYAENIGLSSNESGAGLLDVYASLIPPLSVSTDFTSTVTYNSADVSGSLTGFGDASSADVFFEYGTDFSALNYQRSAGTLYSTGSFETTLNYLYSNTMYYYRAGATAPDGETVYGLTRSFYTPSEDGGIKPTPIAAGENETN